jgi:ATP-dependent DNA helicase MPH1
MNRLRIWINDPNFVGHPKLSYLKEVVLNHFMDAGEGRGGTTQPSSTRIMIFAHYRDSAEEISRVLNRHGPMIRAHVFVGQSGTKGSEGMDQKTQLDIIKKFKAGLYNTIVATSIGEEGLDIGEVDLIVCYDCSKSPIRMLQRMGRTGRKRAGNIVLLLMRGKEHDDYYKAKDNYRVMQEKIENGKEFQYHEDLSPRIVPMEIKPNVDKCVVEIPIENSQPGPLEPKRRRAKNPKKPPKKFHMPDGVETGFTFLGGSKKARNGTKANAKTPESNKDKEVALLAPLEKVLLTAAEEEQLDERYVKLAGTEDEYIRHVRFDAFPEQQQRLGKTTAVKHSKATQTIVKAFRAMRDPSQDWERPAEDEEIKDVDVKRVLTAEKAAATRPKKRPAKQPRQPLNPPSSATNDTPGEYDDNDSFIDNGSLPRSDPAGASSDRDISPPEPSPVADKPFWISQESIGVETCEEDLPDITSLFEKSQTANAFPMNISKARAPKTSRARRVVESDDEDE